MSLRFHGSFDVLRKWRGHARACVKPRAGVKEKKKVIAEHSVNGLVDVIEWFTDEVVNAFVDYYHKKSGESLTDVINDALHAGDARLLFFPGIVIQNLLNTISDTEEALEYYLFYSFNEDVPAYCQLDVMLEAAFISGAITKFYPHLNPNDRDAKKIKKIAERTSQIYEVLLNLFRNLEKTGYVYFDPEDEVIIIPLETFKKTRGLEKLPGKERVMREIQQWFNNKQSTHAQQSELVKIPLENIGFMISGGSSLHSDGETMIFYNPSILVFPLTFEITDYIMTRDMLVLQEQSESGYTEVIYVPYSFIEDISKHWIREPLILYNRAFTNSGEGEYYVGVVVYVPRNRIMEFKKTIEHVNERVDKTYLVKQGMKNFIQETSGDWELYREIIEKAMKMFNQEKPVLIKDPQTGAPVDFVLKNFHGHEIHGAINGREVKIDKPHLYERLEEALFPSNWQKTAILKYRIPYKYVKIDKLEEEFMRKYFNEKRVMEKLTNILFDNVLAERKCKKVKLEIKTPGEWIWKEREFIVCPNMKT